MFTKLWKGGAAALLLVALTVAAACGNDDEDSKEPATPDAAAAATVSARDKIDIAGVEELSDGTLTLGSDIAYAPIEFYDANNVAVGFDIDLANAMAEALGVKAEFQNAGFDSLLPSLAAERYDALMSSMTASEERKQTVDFVEYFVAGIGIIVKAGNPKAINSLQDLCGKTVAVQKATYQVDLIQGTTDAPGGQNKACTDAGKGGITLREFDTDPEAVQALVAGQADAELADFPVAAYSATQNSNTLAILDTQIEPAPYGIAVRKSSTELRDALQEAYDAVVKSGQYDQILKKWGLESGRLE